VEALVAADLEDLEEEVLVVAELVEAGKDQDVNKLFFASGLQFTADEKLSGTIFIHRI
jgi:hypothetical protein